MSRKRSRDQDEKLSGFVYYDVMIQYCALVTLFFVLVMMQPHNKVDGESVMAGRVCAELYWPNDRNVDIDLWSKSPVDKEAVSYGNMHSASTDLMRDVIGFRFNPEHVNMEIACINKLYEGEYVFNAKYFGSYDKDKFPLNIDVTMLVRVKKMSGSEEVVKRTVKFTYEKEQHTFFDFRLNEYGEIVKDSINFTEHPL
jgi:hypothetical protein